MTEVWTPTTIPWEKCSQRRKDQLARAWLSGSLEYKLDPIQKQDAAAIKRHWADAKSAATRWSVLDCARRYGKDSTMGVLAAEICIRQPGARVPYGAPTQKDVIEILEDTFQPMLSDCPPEIRPVWRKSDCRYIFPNGSRLVLVGFDLYPNRARGRSMDAWFLTEPGFFTDLEYVFRGVLLSQALTSPHARGVMGSTPSKTPAHPWSSQFVPTAKARRYYTHRTLWDNPRVDELTKRAFIEETGGEESSDTRREWYAEHVADENLMIIPEFPREKTQIVKEFERPKWFDAYTVIDPGVVDLFAGLFGYWDFERGKICIEDEFAVPQANTRRVAGILEAKEQELWGDCARYAEGRMLPQPFARYSDVELRLIMDLSDEHGLEFIPSAKDNLHAQVNAVRLAVYNRVLEIHPRCKQLISHLEHGVWRPTKHGERKQFERSGEHGHFDLVAALIYFVRNVSKTRNPNPPPDFGLGNEWHINPDRVKAATRKNISRMFERPARQHPRRRAG